MASVEDGGTATFETVSHEGLLPDQGGDPIAFFGSFGIPKEKIMEDAVAIAAAGPGDSETDGPHIVTGPVAVSGAHPGDVLRIEVLSVEMRTRYGIVSNRHGRGVLAGTMPREDASGKRPEVVSHLAKVEDDGLTGVLGDAGGRALRFPLGPFLGLIGVAPATDHEPSSRPPGRHGGNLDIRHLMEGASLLLPVQAEGALVYTGDPHFAQGNGEVALTAFEAPLTATLRLSVERSREACSLAAQIAGPWAETPTHLIAIGLGESLDDAMRQAVADAIAIVTLKSGTSEGTALSYLSAAADFEISQAVNGIRGVHAMIRKADLGL